MLHREIRYTGNPSHKRNPGDFGLTPPSAPRMDASLCDKAGIDRRTIALKLLKSGVTDFFISQRVKGAFPTQIWAVKEDIVFEAQLENEVLGQYHGYPLPLSDPFRDVVLEARKGLTGV